MRLGIDPYFALAIAWGKQAAWFIDPVNGDDRNSGATAATAIKTWAEFVERVRVVSVAMTVTILGNVTEHLIGHFIGETGASLQINGSPTTLATATGTTFSDPVRAGAQSMGTMTSGDVADFTPYLGKMLRSSDGRFAPIIGLNGVAPSLPYWASEALSNTKPANGLAVEILDLVTAPSVQISTVGMPVTLRYIRTTSTAFASGSWVKSDNLLGATLVCCDFGSHLMSLTDTTVIGCQLSGTGNVYSYAALRFVGGGSRGRGLFRFGLSGFLSAQGFIVNGNGTLANGLVIGNGVNASALAQFVSSGGTLGIGIFNCTSDAVVLGQGGHGSFQSLFGAGNGGYGLSIGSGARAWCATTPTVTGASGDLRFCGIATATPPLVAGAAVPAAAPLASWADWVAAPFNRQAMHYGNGTVLAGA